MIFEQHLYGDPAKIAEHRQNKSCKGCKHEHSEILWDKKITICIKVMKNGNRRNHGKKCQDYDQKGK